MLGLYSVPRKQATGCATFLQPWAASNRDGDRRKRTGELGTLSRKELRETCVTLWPTGFTQWHEWANGLVWLFGATVAAGEMEAMSHFSPLEVSLEPQGY